MRRVGARQHFSVILQSEPKSEAIELAGALLFARAVSGKTRARAPGRNSESLTGSLTLLSNIKVEIDVVAVANIADADAVVAVGAPGELGRRVRNLSLSDVNIDIDVVTVANIEDADAVVAAGAVGDLGWRGRNLSLSDLNPNINVVAVKNIEDADAVIAEGAVGDLERYVRNLSLSDLNANINVVAVKNIEDADAVVAAGAAVGDLERRAGNLSLSRIGMHGSKRGKRQYDVCECFHVSAPFSDVAGCIGCMMMLGLAVEPNPSMGARLVASLLR